MSIESIKRAILILAVGNDMKRSKELRKYLLAKDCWITEVKDSVEAANVNQQIPHHFILFDSDLRAEDMLSIYGHIKNVNPMTRGIFMVEGQEAKEDLLRKSVQEDPHVLICENPKVVKFLQEIVKVNISLKKTRVLKERKAK